MNGKNSMLKLMIIFSILGMSTFGAVEIKEATDIAKTKKMAVVTSLEQQIVTERKTLLEEVRAEKLRVEALILEKEKELKKEEAGAVELVQEADWYSKYHHESDQVILSLNYEETGKRKDNTEKEFAETIQAIRDTKDGSVNYLAGDKSITSMSNGEIADTFFNKNNDGIIIKEQIEGGKGIDIGANVQPVEPVLPEIELDVETEVSGVEVNVGEAPKVTLGNIGSPEINPPAAPPTLGTVTAPATPTIVKPTGVPKIDVTPPSAPDPTIPAEKEVNPSAPVAPGVFSPTTITQPTIPTIPVINPPTGLSLTINSNHAGANNKVWYWYKEGKLGPISQINITEGTFTATSGTGDITGINISGYVGAPTTTNGTDNYTNSAGDTSDRTNETATSTVGFYKWVGAPFIRLGTAGDTEHDDVEFNFIGAGRARALLKNDTHGDNAQTLDDLKNGTSNQSILDAEYDFARDKVLPYHKHSSGVNGNNNSASTTKLMYGINYGTWNLSGSGINGYEADGHNTDNSEFAAVVFQNAGIINTANGSSSIAIMAYAPDAEDRNRTFTSVNNGDININGSGSAIFAPNRQTTNHELNFLNYGNLVINGGQNAGLYLAGTSNAGSTIYMEKPLEIYGDKNIGVYLLNGAHSEGGSKINQFSFNSDSVFKVNIGVNQDNADNEDRNINQSTNASGNDATGTTPDTTMNDKIIEKNIAVYIKESGGTLASHEINIGNKTSGNVGVWNQAGTALNLGTGSINIYGGTGNTGIYFDTNSTVTSTGDINISGGSGNAGIYLAGAGANVSVGNISVSGSQNVGVYAFGVAPNKIFNNELGTVTVNGTSVGIYTKGTGGNLEITKTNLSQTDDNVVVSGNGVGLLASDGGQLKAVNYRIKATDATGVASTGGTVILNGSEVDAYGRGYALYSDGTGTINLTNSNLNLYGQTTAYDIYLESGNSGKNTITLDATSKINVHSDNVIVFNVKDAPTLNTTGLRTTFAPYTGNIVDSSPNSLYKVASLGDGILNVGNLDKAGTSTDASGSALGDGYFYYNKLLTQRMETNISNGTVSAILNNTQDNNFKDQVVAFEMNASREATSNAETTINVTNSSKVISDRTETGAGAIGLYTNYGQISVDGTSEILVEKGVDRAGVALGTDVVNNGAVGVYAVNGSSVSNAGNIEVGGNSSFGIYSTAYRITNNTTGATAGAEWGNAASNQGEIAIENSNTITLDGTGSVGIFADNNNTAATNTTSNITNTSTVTVGNSTVGTVDGKEKVTATAVGIYGNKTTISNTGAVSAGTNGIGIFGTNKSSITNLGTIKLAEDGIGVYLDGDSTLDLTAPNTSVIFDSSVAAGADVEGGTGFFIKGGSGAYNLTSLTSIDATKFSAGTAIYAESAKINVGANIIIGNAAVGIMLTKGSEATSSGDITFDTNAEGSVGMYAGSTGGKSTATNTGTITVNDVTNIGMLTKGGNLKNIGNNLPTPPASLTGVININDDKAIGMYSQSQNDDGTGDTGYVEFTDGTIDVGDTNTKTIGVYLKNESEMKINGTINYSETNANENILVYSDKSTVTFDDKGGTASTIKIDGKTVDADGKKTVGIYLSNGSTFKTDKSTGAVDGKITVENQAIGVYSNGTDTTANTVDDIDITSKGKQTIGVYAVGNMNIDGTVTVADDGEATATNQAMGIYGNDASITVTGGELTLKNDDVDGLGTGAYLTNGSSFVSGNINVENTNTTDKFVGVYYTTEDPATGTETTPSTNGANLKLKTKNNIGYYVDSDTNDKLTLTNTGTITEDASITAGNPAGNLGVMVTSGATYTGGTATGTSGEGDITLQSDDAIGILASNGTATNDISADINLYGTTANGAVGMMAQGKLNETSTINNAGTINANGNVGMVLSNADTGVADTTYTGTNVATNTGTINVSTGTGVFIQGTGDDTTTLSTFDGTNGNINVAIPTIIDGTTDSYGLGIYLNGTDAGTVTNTGTLNVTSYKNTTDSSTNSGTGIGVYANNSVVNFDISTANASSHGEISLYAKGTSATEKTTISGATISGSDEKTVNQGGTDVAYTSIGVFFNDNNVEIGNGTTVNAGTKGTGIYIGKDVGSIGSATPHVIGNTTINTNTGVGIYLGNDVTTAAATEGADISANGTINVGKKADGSSTTDGAGVGVYISDKSSFTNGILDMVLSGKDSVGIYIENGGTITVGHNAGTEEFTMYLNGGIGIFNNEGTVTLGKELIIDGGSTGTLIKTINGIVSSELNLKMDKAGQAALLGEYDGTKDASLTSSQTTTPTDTEIEVTNGGIGMAAINKLTANSTAVITMTNTGTINASGKDATPGTVNPNPSIGMYSEVADIVNTGTINVEKDAVGIYAKGNVDRAMTIEASSTDSVSLNEEGATGVVVKANEIGTTDNKVTIKDTNISSTVAGTTGMVIENADSNTTVNGNLNISLADDSKGLTVKNDVAGTDGMTLANTTVVVGDSVAKTAVGVIATSTETHKLNLGNADITAGKKAVAVYAENVTTTVEGITDSSLTVGEGGVYTYAKNGATLDFAGAGTGVGTSANGLIVDEKRTGVYLQGDGSANKTTAKNLDKVAVGESGVGVYITDGEASITSSSIGTIDTTLELANGTETERTIGIYYSGNLAKLTEIDDIVIDYADRYSIGYVLDKTNANTSINDITLTDGEKNVGVYLKEAGTLNTETVTVSGSGDSNVGVFAKEKSNVKVNNGVGNTAIDVDYTATQTASSVGLYLDGGNYDVTGTIDADKESIGIYSINGGNAGATENKVTGDLKVGDGALGIYNSGNKVTLDTTTGGVNSVVVGNFDAVGVLGNDGDISVKTNQMIVGEKSLGIASTGSGNIDFTGNANVGKVGLTGADKDNASVGIYKKDGTGTITANGTMEVENFSYGMYVTGANSQVTIDNNSDINSKDGAIGIYSVGKNTVTNSGKLTVGKSYYGADGNPTTYSDNSNGVGIYAEGGTTVENESGGIIDVKNAYSIGIYAKGSVNEEGDVNDGTTITNRGTINVDNGGIGMFVRDGAVAYNYGTINLGEGITSETIGDKTYEAITIGMAAYNFGVINNYGEIHVGDGVGMYVGADATLNNYNKIFVKNGAGISGYGILGNYGHISIVPGGTGEKNTMHQGDSYGAVSIDRDGNVTISDKYYAYAAYGGGLSVQDGKLNLDGAWVDVSGATNGIPIFEATEIEGEFNVLPNFSLTGNGYSYGIDNFINVVSEGGDISNIIANIPKLWVATITKDGDLVIVKKLYSDITVGEQFENMDVALDNILMYGDNEGDKDILQELNYYLSSINQDDFENEAADKLAEFRGDIYSTIQRRMENIDDSFDDAFYDLENTTNITTDSGKLSVIHTKSDYNDETTGIDDYDYTTTGLMYMKENEHVEYKSKTGYSVAFAVSDFEFDDEGTSKEQVLSLRLGAHRVKELKERKIEWLTSFDITGNFHQADRKIDIGYRTIENQADYGTYAVGLTNKFSKTLKNSYTGKLDSYLQLGLEYGYVDKFKEYSGNILLDIDDNDYYSIKPEIGVEGNKKYYIGEFTSINVVGKVSGAYELGEMYDGNKARVREGGEGWYDLITPEKDEGEIKASLGVTYEDARNFSVGFEVEGAYNTTQEQFDQKYSVKFKYVF